MPNSLEQREPDEAALIAEMIAILRRKMASDYAGGKIRRDAHPKTVGLLRGKFRIAPDLPPELRVGLFKQAQNFDCWVRVSNSSGRIQSDAIKDARGIAIKLLAPRVRGADTHAELGQDFVLLNSPTMPLGTVKLFRDAVFYAIESSPLLLGAKFLLTGHAAVLTGLLGLRTRPNSPLDIRYWSTTPYRFGRSDAVKYSLLPTSGYRSPKPDEYGESYLSDAMQAHLGAATASFDFCVQLRRDDMPIEDAAVRWDERRSPFIKVATLEIPKQNFRTTKRETLAEALRFSPAHALREHLPLGGLNRAREKIYRALARFRQGRQRA